MLYLSEGAFQMILTFISALGVGFSGAIMPGSLLTYTIRKSLTHGPVAGLIITAGHAILELFLIIMIFLGFDAVLQSDTAQFVISILGGALLIYMGIDMLVGSIKNSVKVRLDGSDTRSGSMFLSGIIISASNPYFLLWWAVIGLGFLLQSYSAYGLAGVIIYYIGHICADFIWYLFISTIVGTTRRFLGEKPYRVIISILGCLLVYFGGSFIVSAVPYLT